MRGYFARWRERRGVHGAAMRALVAGAALVLVATASARAQNITDNEFKFGVLDHDTHLLEGKEHGIDLNPEVNFPSPVSDAWTATMPWYTQWFLQPRPTIGGEFNTSHYTNDYYLGLNWSWWLTRNILKPDDGLTFGFFFGPGFNDGQIRALSPDRKSLGYPILFREAFELGYQITPKYGVSAFLDHVSNGGLAKENQSINDLGVRLGVRF
ncbi:MAG: acyloxyacyl hydrolase [Alphaproteobacteria bacterium]|nr:acyloxyacyl hydrolase [Alphaproteobacteria bacterium]